MTRQLFLRLMLVALGITALLAIAQVYAASETAWRLLSTAFLSALACGLMLPITPRTADKGMDLLQRTVAGFILVSFAAWVAGIWNALPRALQDAVAAWFFLGIPSLLVAIFAMRSRRREDRALAFAEKVTILGAFGSLGAALLVATASAIGIEAALQIGFAALVGTIVAGSSAIGLRAPSSVRFAPPPPPTRGERGFAMLGIAAGAAWTLLATAAVLEESRGRFAAVRETSVFWPVATAALGVALSCGIWCGIGLSRVTGVARFLRHVAASTAFALGAVVTYAVAQSVLAPERMVEEWLVRLISALAIVGSTSLIAALVMLRLTKGRAIATDPIESIEWSCPRCATRAQIGCGEHCCAGCGLAVLIEFRDDRCPACAYDLRGQTAAAAKCPECGRARQVPVTSA